MTNEIQQTIKDWELLEGLSEEDIEKIINASQKRTFKSGDMLCRQGETGESMFMILFGRVRMRVNRDGSEQNLNVLQQGDHFGELTLLIGGERTATATAIMDTAVLEINKEDFYRLSNEVPAFAINLSRTIGGWLRGELSGKIRRTKISLMGLVRSCSVTGSVIKQIASFIVEKKRRVEVFTDRPGEWNGVDVQKLHEIKIDENGVGDSQLRLQLNESAERCDHVIIDIDHKRVAGELLTQCEHVWWLARQDVESGFELADRISRLIKDEPTLGRRLQMAWVQQRADDLAAKPQEIETSHSDLRIQYDPETGNVRRNDLSRFYHQAIGVHLGLALGGGGARGLAHIGVIAALNEHDIYFDRIAGTSAGAIIGATFASGFDSEYTLGLFDKEMTPPKWVGMMPRGTKLYLMTLFRFRLIEQRFRRYLKKYTFDQLLLPMHMVSVDLISGEEKIRETGDVVSSMMESINHPLFGNPIFRDGEALVDGGVLNNVPSSVLRKHHADYVVSVDVGTKLSANFGKNNSQTPVGEMKKVGYLATLNRVLDVSHRGLGQLHSSESDYFINPDTSDFPFDDFTAGRDLFKIGYDATIAIMDELKEKYHGFINQE